VPQGRGIIRFGHDFTGGNGTAAALDASGIQAFGVGTEVYGNTVDESGGILAFATGASDNDNAVLRAGPFAPRDGKMVVNARFKYSNVDTSVFVGFSETLDPTTPVMPIEFATGTTLTFNGTGGMVGLLYDVDATTDDFRALMGDAAGGISDTGALGIRANATLTADRWFEATVILNEDGSAECWLGDSGHADSNSMNKMRLIKRFSSGTLLTPTDLFFACLIIENRSGNTRTLEIDYFEGQGGRDWRYD